MPKRDQAKISKVSVSLPFGIGKVEWVPDSTQRRAAWSLYVELVTRISVQPLEPSQGHLHEALSSLYNLFETTREILKDAGPDVGASKESVGGIAISTLNLGLRPFLTKWHPLLKTWEEKKESNVSTLEHERNWSEKDKFRNEMETLRNNLSKYANALAKIAGV